MLMGLRRPWTPRHIALLLALLAAGVWIHRLALADIFAIAWRNEEQSHILVVPLIAAWLFWLRRSRLRSVRIYPSLFGPALIVLGWLANWLGIGIDVHVLWHAGALTTLLGCVVSLTGLEPIRAFAPALIALLFLIPIPGRVLLSISLPMQTWATDLTQMMLELIGVAAVRTGNVLTINGEEVAIGEACNGLRMVFALGLVSYATAFSMRLRFGVRFLLLALSPLTAILTNVLRLVPTTVIFGYGTSDQARFFHDISGWVMLPMALIMLIGVLRTIRWVDLPLTSFRLAMR